MSVPAWVGRYIGIPFAENGFAMTGCNCWGLVHLVLAQERGIAVPTYGEISASELLAAARSFRRDAITEPWREITDGLRAFDCVVMSAMTDDARMRLPGHVGILVSPTRVLHVWKAADAVHMPLDHHRVRNKIIGFHRHRELA